MVSNPSPINPAFIPVGAPAPIGRSDAREPAPYVPVWQRGRGKRLPPTGVALAKPAAKVKQPEGDHAP